MATGFSVMDALNKNSKADRMRKELTEKVVQINDRTSLNQIIRCKSNRK